MTSDTDSGAPRKPDAPSLSTDVESMPPGEATSDAVDAPGASRGRRLPVRVVALVAVILCLGAMVSVDRFVGRTPQLVTVGADDVIGPIATDPRSALSTWFCAGGSMDGENDDLIVTVTNPTDNETSGTITFYGDAGEREDLAVTVAPRSRTFASARSRVLARHVAALVELDRGGIAVDHRIEQGGLNSISPCASSPSTTWYVADGNTQVGSSMELSLFNPFGEDAIVDLSFATDEGPATPAALQGYVVPRNSVASIDVGSHVRRRRVVSAIVRARVGRLAVDEVQKTTSRPKGLALSLASPSTGEAWYFPNGRSTSKLKERYVLFNPTDEDISAQIDFIIDGAESEPFDIDIPKLSQAELVPGDESRIPVDVGYSVVVATDDPTLVVSRTLVATSSLRSGRSITMGARRIANRWLVPDALASKKRDDRLAFLNPTDTDAAVTVSVIANGTTTSIPGLERVLLAAGQRLGIRVGDYASVDSDSSILVESEGAPVIVERTASGISATAGGPRPEQPVLVAVDSTVVLSPPDADSGVDQDPDTNATADTGGDTTVADGETSDSTESALGVVGLPVSGGRSIAAGVRLAVAATSTVVNGPTTTAIPATSTAPSSTASTSTVLTGPTTPAAGGATTTTTTTAVAATATPAGGGTTTTTTTTTTSTTTTKPDSVTTTTTEPTTTSTTSATTKPAAVTTTTVPVPVVAVARPTAASGSTSSAMAIPLDLG